MLMAGVSNVVCSRRRAVPDGSTGLSVGASPVIGVDAGDVSTVRPWSLVQLSLLSRMFRLRIFPPRSSRSTDCRSGSVGRGSG